MGLPKPTPPLTPITRASQAPPPNSQQATSPKMGDYISDPWLVFVQRLLTYIAQKVETGLEANLPSPADVYPDVVYFATDTQIGRISDGQTWTPFIYGTGVPLSGMTDGQLIIGRTGLSPALNTLTQGAGLTITNGPGSITIAADLGSASFSSLHTHGTTRLTGDGATTVFTLVDVADSIETVSNAGAIVDPLTVTLSADGTQLTFAAAPGVGNVLVITYVIARV